MPVISSCKWKKWTASELSKLFPYIFVLSIELDVSIGYSQYGICKSIILVSSCRIYKPKGLLLRKSPHNHSRLDQRQYLIRVKKIGVGGGSAGGNSLGCKCCSRIDLARNCDRDRNICEGMIVAACIGLKGLIMASRLA